MSKIIIPGDTTPGKRIFVPNTAMPVYRCTVPTEPGKLCGKEFYEDEFRKFVSHATACARAHEQEIHERSPRTALPIIHEPWDAEYEAWMRRLGERMEAEGRVEQHPGEY